MNGPDEASALALVTDGLAAPDGILDGWCALPMDERRELARLIGADMVARLESNGYVIGRPKRYKVEVLGRGGCGPFHTASEVAAVEKAQAVKTLYTETQPVIYAEVVVPWAPQPGAF